MKIIDRLFIYFEAQGIKHTAFEKKIGLSNGYLNTQLKRNSDLGEAIILKIVNNCLDLNRDWLLFGEGNMLKNPELMSEDEIKQHDVEVEAGKWHYSSKMEKDFSETEHYNNIIGAMQHEIEELRNRLAEYAERLSEQKETINAQKDLITILKKSSPKTQQCATDKSRTQV
jgi:hypothetical protein